MATQSVDNYQQILTFWFGELDDRGQADALHAARWWKRDPSFDASIRERFGAVHDAVANGRFDHWLGSPRGRLAFIITLDQFSRNMFRGSDQMFAFDKRALEVAIEGVDLGAHRSLALDERCFFYMPFMHSEDLAAQQRGVALFVELRDELTGEPRQRVANNLHYAEQHRDIIQRFARFPHRNALLGRASAPEELTFLTQPGSSFL